MAKRPLTNDELRAHLEEQLGFIEASATSFDGGLEGEAKRLAVTIRVLLHDTKASHSLLGQLNAKNVDFFDTAFEFDPKNISPHGGLVFIAHGPPRTRYVAMLDDVPVKHMTPFDTWWNAPVFVDKERRELSRKDLVLTAANQDGGAHVDPALDDVYYSLTRGNSLGWTVSENGIARPMEGPERAAIRQIAHEVLKTFKPGYSKMLKHEAGFVMGGMSLKVGPSSSKRPAPSVGAKVGRNSPCPCGSGKKFKKCCGAYA